MLSLERNTMRNSGIVANGPRHHRLTVFDDEAFDVAAFDALGCPLVVMRLDRFNPRQRHLGAAVGDGTHI